MHSMDIMTAAKKRLAKTMRQMGTLGGWFARATGATRSLLGLSPSHAQIVSALLKLPPEAARVKVESMAVAALTDGRAPPVVVKTSLVKDKSAGCGLFLRCDVAAAAPGALIALYAGIYTPPAPAIAAGIDWPFASNVTIPGLSFGDGGGGHWVWLFYMSLIVCLSPPP